MRTLATVCLLALTLAACAPAAKTPPPTKITFEQVDRDKDGKVTLDEVLTVTKNPDRSAVESHFKAQDWKGQGYLDTDQFDVWRDLDYDGDL